MIAARSGIFVLIPLLAMLALPRAAVAQEDGASLYKQHCAKCHGDDGSGKTAATQRMKVVDLCSDEVQKQQDHEIFDSIAHGLRHKQYPHAFQHRGLTEAQITKLVGYLRDLPKSRR
jgi:mono/diheme cytochrome c family protein